MGWLGLDKLIIVFLDTAPVVLVALVNKESVLCPSKNLLESLENETPFCTITGMTCQYISIQREVQVTFECLYYINHGMHTHTPHGYGYILGIVNVSRTIMQSENKTDDSAQPINRSIVTRYLFL